VVELANAVLAGIDLRQVAHPFLIRLVSETGESAFLTVVSGDESVCIDRVESAQPVRVTLSIGGRYPLYAGASNKVLLAYLSPGVIDRIVAGGLEPITPRTITDPAAFKADLALIRQQGWAYSVGELTPEVAAIAVPLWDGNGRVVAALSIAGLASRFTEDRLPMLLGKVRQAAQEISTQLVAWREDHPELVPALQ
jgi:DNA-binding IclR family transcriptional regulator